jgi:hypothetical protein
MTSFRVMYGVMVSQYGRCFKKGNDLILTWQIIGRLSLLSKVQSSPKFEGKDTVGGGRLPRPNECPDDLWVLMVSFLISKNA